MIQGKQINLRLVQNIEECQMLIESYNDLSQRAQTEIKSFTALHKQFAQNGLWTEDAGTLLITNIEGNLVGTIGFTTLNECPNFEDLI